MTSSLCIVNAPFAVMSVSMPNSLISSQRDKGLPVAATTFIPLSFKLFTISRVLAEIVRFRDE